MSPTVVCSWIWSSCVFVPEGTVPGWAVDTETGNGEFSDIAGIWYLDGDADAISSLEIDEQGNWTLFERLDSDDDLIEADCGYLKRDTAKEDTYYAHSRQFEDVIYDMSTDFDKEVIWWGGENDAYLLPQTTRSAGEIIEQYVGYWSDGEDFWLRIYRDGSWDTVKESGKIINRGSTVAKEDGIVLYMMDHGYVGTFVLQNGSLYDADADVAYAPVMEADIPEASRTDLNWVDSKREIYAERKQALDATSGVWYYDSDLAAETFTKVLIQRRCSIWQATRTLTPLEIQYFQGGSYVYDS